MPLTPEQQAQLEALQAESSKPEPRTGSGLAGILHTVLDVVSGAVPHLAADAWTELHHQVESHLGELPPAEPADVESQDGDGQDGEQPSERPARRPGRPARQGQGG